MPDVTILSHLAFTDGRPNHIDQFDAATVTYTDGTRQLVWYPIDMAAVLFVDTVNWLKSRVGSRARLQRLEFDR